MIDQKAWPSDLCKVQLQMISGGPDPSPTVQMSQCACPLTQWSTTMPAAGDFGQRPPVPAIWMETGDWRRRLAHLCAFLLPSGDLMMRLTIAIDQLG